jgi:2-amino-4-hydroxy-6-hydroxymethyldihydropteridine diphosphokinase
MNKVYLLLGSNLEDPKAQLVLAHRHLREKIGHVHQQSSLYQTAAWGNGDQPDFLNQVVLVNTEMTAPALLEKLLRIEKDMGRIRTEKNAPRLIDIDILFYNSDVITTNELSVPHPALEQRRFVLVPLNELSPDFVHPRLNKTITQLLTECTDNLDVKRF